MSADALIGTQLDEYRLETLLGQGGMARVYIGLDVRLDRRVAIKVIDAPFRADSDYMMRFEREAKAIAQLQHPHIVSLYRYGEADGTLYMAMQYVEGSSMDSMLAGYRDEGELIPVAEARRVMQQICQALDYAHSKGVIHRDIKPANIILDKQGNAFLADFGLALLTAVGTQGEIFGTPHYVAPEQAISSKGAVPQSDLYSVGVMLYEMFTGEVPFDADSAMDVAMMHMSEPPPPPREVNPDLTPELEGVLLKALEKEPADRYQSGAELIEALDRALKASSQVALPIPPPRMSIPNRVAIDLAAHPLPPMPAGMSKPAPPPPPPAPVPSTSEATKVASKTTLPPPTPKDNRQLVYAGLGLGAILAIIVIILIILVGAFLLLRGGPSDTAAPAATPSPIVGVAASSEGTATPSGDNTTADTSDAAGSGATGGDTAATEETAGNGGETPPPPEPTTPPDYTVLFAKRKDHSLYVLNQGSAPFPLGPLQMTDNERLFNAGRWDVSALSSGDCVAIWKDKGKVETPDLSCNETARLEISDRQRFWKEGYSIYYGGQLIGNCAQDRCEMTIPVSLSESDERIGGGDDDD
jgi:serine/threonine protein kinase